MAFTSSIQKLLQIVTGTLLPSRDEEFLAAERIHSLIHALWGTPTLNTVELTFRHLFLAIMGTLCCWRNWLSLLFYFILLSSATVLKILLTAFPQKSCGLNPPSSWKAVGHHLQQSIILQRFFCWVIFNSDHFISLFYSLTAQRKMPGQTWSRAGKAACPPGSTGRATEGLLPSDHGTWLKLSCSNFTSPNWMPDPFVLQVWSHDWV